MHIENVDKLIRKLFKETLNSKKYLERLIGTKKVEIKDIFKGDFTRK